ncbi:heat shock 70 kDa protein 12B-like [Mya arenaria]|uniref:heat shock 70 kDa protein 12B-like n=1 Tax=Mya arenaria TaxID=6604 RepID=UPI0022E59688|nr:heat shock 70 kDa protein 12B-like [Mya arenaria]XP_052789014.1 heat shock 70 kDa protein 12B-like [Mya arenaria]
MAEKGRPEKHNYLLVAAFDFGTTYSGYAYSLRDSPTHVHVNNSWAAGVAQLMSLKTSTSVLLNPAGDFHSFGFEAEAKYADLAEDGKHAGWRLFRRFKMMLHNNTQLNRDSTIEDIQGNPSPALPIFTHAIHYLREHVLEFINKSSAGVTEADVFYVITVPAIWDVRAKQFMREAAEKAGIPTDQLKLVLEPEVASIWCEEELEAADTRKLQQPGIRYMVVDAGGGTVDVSVHERNDNGTLKEIHKASGGAWGGTEVDKRYLQTLDDIFGEESMRRLKEETMMDFLAILEDFEVKKRTPDMRTRGFIMIKIPASLREYCEEKKGKKMADVVKDSVYGESVVYKAPDKLRVPWDIVKTWFDKSVDNTINHVKHLLELPNISEVETIILVGGFVESTYVQERFREALGDKRILIPNEPGLAVLKGAVKFGHNPAVVASRMIDYTYGVRGELAFDPKKHKEENKIMKNRGNVFAKDCFVKFCSINEEVLFGQKFKRTSRGSSSKKSSKLLIYRSRDSSPVTVSDSACEKIGRLTINYSEEDVEDDDFKIETSFTFGDTELLVKRKMLKSGKEVDLKIDCLGQV